MKVYIRAPLEKDVDTRVDSQLTCRIVVGASDPCRATEEITEQQSRVEGQTVTPVEGAEVTCSTCKLGLNDEFIVSNSENKENASIPAANIAEGR